MFKEKLKNDINMISPAPALLDKVSLIMAEQASKPVRSPYAGAIRFAAAAAAVFLISSFAAVKLGVFSGENKINTAGVTDGGAASETVPETAAVCEQADEAAVSNENGTETFSPRSGGEEDKNNALGDFSVNAASVSAENAEAPTEAAEAADTGARGGDELVSYRYPLNGLIGAISTDFINMVGIDEFEKWLKEKSAEQDISDIDKQADLYSFINDFNIDREAAKDILYRYMTFWGEYGIVPNYTEDDIRILLYGTKNEVAENFVSDSSVYHNGKLYPPEWFNTHTAADYAAEEIPPEKIKEKLGKMLECARYVSLDTLVKEVGGYIGETVEIPEFPVYSNEPSAAVLDDTFIEVSTVHGEEGCNITGEETDEYSIEVDDEETRAMLISVCQKFMTDNFPADDQTGHGVSAIINWDNPDMLQIERPQPESIIVLDEKAAESAFECYSVTFFTSFDDLLGPIVFYVNKEGTIFGEAVRE